MSTRAALIWAAINFAGASAFWYASDGSLGIWNWTIGCVFVGMAAQAWLNDGP